MDLISQKLRIGIAGTSVGADRPLCDFIGKNAKIAKLKLKLKLKFLQPPTPILPSWWELERSLYARLWKALLGWDSMRRKSTSPEKYNTDIFLALGAVRIVMN